MIIDVPYDALPEETLNRLIEEFVTREGTSYGEREYTLAEMVEHVKNQLKNKKAFIQFDDQNETCHIITEFDKKQQVLDEA